MTVAVNVEGTKRALAKFALDLEVACSVAIGEALEAAENAARNAIKATTKRRTGALEDKLQGVMLSTTSGKFFALAEHARYIDEGTPPHIIAAKGGRWLRFEQAGTVMFRRVVRHPGTKPRPFVASAQASGQMALRNTLNQIVNQMVRRF